MISLTRAIQLAQVAFTTARNHLPKPTTEARLSPFPAITAHFIAAVEVEVDLQVEVDVLVAVAATAEIKVGVVFKLETTALAIANLAMAHHSTGISLIIPFTQAYPALQTRLVEGVQFYRSTLISSLERYSSFSSQ